MHGHPIAIENPHIAHTHPVDSQQIIGMRLKQRGIDRIMAEDAFRSEYRLPRRNAPNQWQAQLLHQTDAARSPGNHHQRAFTRQCMQVFLRRIHIHRECVRKLCAGRR